MAIEHDEVLALCKEVIEKAKIHYGMDLSNIPIRFDLKGRAMGFAYRRPLSIRFNNDMVRRGLFLTADGKATIPHEFAHIICFKNPALGKNHDDGWRRVDRILGGNGQRCHNEEIVYGKGLTFEYTATCGTKDRVSQTVHRRIQQGNEYFLRKTGGKLNKNCSYVIVGHQGRTLQQPIVPKLSPAQPVQPLRITPLNEAAAREMGVSWPLQQTTVPTNPATPAPYVPRSAPQPQVVPTTGASKADVARRIMVEGQRRGLNHEEMIQAIMRANGHSYSLAKSYFINNASKCGIIL